MRRRRFLQGAASLSALGCDPKPVPPGRQAATFWYSYGGHNRQILEGLVEQFNRSQSRYYILPVFQGDYYETLAKLRVAIAAEVGPTISHVIGEVVPYLAQAGVLQSLKGFQGSQQLQLIEQLGQSGTWVAGDTRPLLALPFNRSTPIMYVNATLFEQQNLKPPQTWSEMRHIARRLTTARRHGFECPITWWFWVALTGQAGGQIVEPDGTPTLGGRAGVEAIEFWQTLVHQDRSMKLPAGRDANAWEITNQDYLAGRVGMIWTSTAFLKYLEQNASFQVQAVKLPKHRRHSTPTGGTFFVMLKSAPPAEQQAGWAFLRWMMQAEQTITWAKQTGYMPVTKPAVARLKQQGYYRTHPNHRVALDQLEVAQPWPWSEELFRIQREVVQPRVEKAVITNANARRLMADARALARQRI